MKVADVKPAPDYANEIAEKRWGQADSFPQTPSELRAYGAACAREGYALGYAAGGGR